MLASLPPQAQPRTATHTHTHVPIVGCVLLECVCAVSARVGWHAAERGGTFGSGSFSSGVVIVPGRPRSSASVAEAAKKLAPNNGRPFRPWWLNVVLLHGISFVRKV